MPRNHDVEPEGVPADRWDAVDQIKGYLTRAEGDLLWRYAGAPWCEIGTYCGRSAAVLSGKGHGYCVDLFLDWYDSRAALDGANVTTVKGDFREVVGAVPDGLQFLYLDADHELDATLEAFWLYEPKVVPGGHIAIHDAFELHPGVLDWPGVNAAVHVLTREAYQLVAASHRVAVFRKS